MSHLKPSNLRRYIGLLSGCLWLGYTNSMPYDHPLDQQGHIASVLHSDTAAYSSYIGLIALGIPITTRVESRDIYCQYFYIIGTIPGQDNQNIWGSLHFLPLVSNVFLPLQLQDFLVTPSRRRVWF